MSDYVTKFIPEDPQLVPAKKVQVAAVALLRKLAPHADDITSGVDHDVIFRDCGSNFETVACPNCRREIELEIWQGWMEEDYSDGGGFRLGTFVTPCCAMSVRLNDLVYDWPQGFSRYYLEASNIGRPLSAASVHKLEGVLGCKVRVISTSEAATLGGRGMENLQVTFTEWWEEFTRDTADKEDFCCTLDRLLQYVSGLSLAKREAFVQGLVDVAWLRDGSSIALAALTQLAGPDARRRVAGAVESLPHVRPPHPPGDYRHALLRVLAADPDGEFLGPVDDYCTEKIGPGFTSVVWALWPHHKEMFARYHARYFAEEPAVCWMGTLVVQGFLTAPEALSAVRDALIARDPGTWDVVRKAVVTAGTPRPSWVTEQQAKQVQFVCEIEAA